MGMLFDKLKRTVVAKKNKPNLLETDERDLVSNEIPKHTKISVVGPFDDLLPVAVEVVLESGMASVSMLQRKLQISYKRALKLVDEMEQHKIVGSFRDGQLRQILCKNYSDIEFYQKDCIQENQANEKDSMFLNNEFYEFGGSEAELLSVDFMTGFQFESWCAKLLLENGFEKASVTPGSGDFGVDVIAVKDGIHYAIQCKCYSQDIGNSPIQEVYAGKEMYKCQVGVVMTNRHFTAGAQRLAEQTRVLLWDREKLKSLIESAV